MSDEKLLWNTLEAARRLFWQLLVEHERGSLTLPEEWRSEIDSREKICADVLKYCEDDNAGKS